MLGPYAELMRIHKPAGFFLFLWPPVWGLTMAAYSHNVPVHEYTELLLKSAFGAFIMRSSACTVNDIFDRELDASVERTRNRPLASGRISVFAATVFLFLQYAVGIAFFSTFNQQAFNVNMVQMLPMLAAYPLMKRITFWPQAWLGLAINVGFISSWLAIYGQQGSLYLVSSMMVTLWCWTMVYDTIYGCQDRKDDVKIGVRSTAILFGEAVVPATICFAIIFIASLYYAGTLNGNGLPYNAISVGGSAVFLLWKFVFLNVESSPSCWNFFVSNAYFLGAVVYAGMAIDYFHKLNYI